MPNPKTVELLRIPNPWFVGHNTGRIVPLYLAHNLIKNLYEEPSYANTIVRLCRGNPDYAKTLDCFKSWQPNDKQLLLLQDSMFAVYSPDRRIFPGRNDKPSGSPTPVTANLAAGTGSDDGLGNRVFDLLLECNGSNWMDSLDQLMQPSSFEDPITALTASLVGKSERNRKPVVLPDEPREDIEKIESNIANFITGLLRQGHSGNRIAIVEDLGRGAFFGALLLILKLSAEKYTEGQNLVFVYGGRPPGNPNDYLVTVASRSFRRAIRKSYDALGIGLQSELEEIKVPRAIKAKDNWNYRFREVFNHLKSNERELLIQTIDPLCKNSKKSPSVDWCKKLIADMADFSESHFGRRVRVLGGHIGFAGPRRGKGATRLYFEAPLLGTLVRGICAGDSIPFEEFVDELRIQLGIVLGIGTLEASDIELGKIFGAVDPDEALRRNEELFRKRLVRAGLARTYSDSHTEVIAYDT